MCPEHEAGLPRFKSLLSHLLCDLGKLLSFSVLPCLHSIG